MKSNLYTKHPSTVISRWMIVTVCFMIMIMTQNVNAQLTGTKTIPTDYPTLAAAIADLNLVGVGVGGVIISVDPGNPETAPAGGYVIGGAGSLVLTTSSSTQTITIEGNGNIITANGAHTVGALNDGIFKLIGADFVTIQNFTMQENAANTVLTPNASNTMTEFGVAFFYVSTTNGASDNAVRGCTISLNRLYLNSFGIYSNSGHSSTAMATAGNATTATGGNHRLAFTSNNISNVNLGIVVIGTAGAAADQNDGLTIGGSGLSNSITNFGTGAQPTAYTLVSGTVYGILVRNTKNFTVSNNTITSSTGGVTTTSALRGIYVQAFSTAPTGTIVNAINNNIISMTGGNASHSSFHGISVEGTTGNATTTISINNNDFNNWGWSGVASPTGSIIFINNTMANLNTTINGNTFTNLSLPTTGGVTFITHSVSIPASGSQTVSSNSIVTGFTKTGAGGTVTLFNNFGSSPGTVVETYTGNNFSNITLTGATTIDGFKARDGGSPVKTVTNNTFSNWTCGSSAVTALVVSFSGVGTTVSGNIISNITSSGGTMIGLESTSGNQNITGNSISGLLSTGTGAVTGISISGGTTQNVFKNKVCNIESNNASGIVNGISVGGGTTVTLSNNIVGDLRTPASNASNPLNGLNITGGTTVNAYYNTVYLNGSSTGALFGSSAISASTTPTLTLNNNIFVNTSSNNGAGLAVSYRRSTATLTSYSNTSDRNDFFASTLYSDGTTNITSLSAYKALMVAPRDANSINENPPFISTSCGSANFLHIDLASATGVESGGANVGGITDDFDGHIRFGNVGYAGTGTAPDIGADEFDGTPLPACAALSSAGTISGAAAVCTGSGTTLTLTGSPVASGLSYQWFSGTTLGGPYPNALGTGLSQATGPLTATTYFIVVVTCANDASTASTPEKEVFVNALPTITISPSTSEYCDPGAAVSLTASGGVSYTWAPSSGLSVVTGTSVLASPTATTVYTATGTDANGCVNTGTASVTYSAAPGNVSITPSSVSICSGASTNLDASSTLLLASTYSTTVTINDASTGSPYPAVLAVSGLSPVSTLKRVRINGLSHTFPDDIDLLLQSPGGVNVVLMSDVWNGTDAVNVNLVLQDGSPAMPLASIVGGTYSPTNSGATDTYAAPGPGSVTQATPTLATFGAANHNGNWNLYVVDDAGGDIGTIASWSLEFENVNDPSVTYTWSPATGLSATTGTTVTANPASTTQYTVTATKGACSNTATSTVSVGAALVCSPATFTSPNCAGTDFTVTANVSGGGAPYSYSWSDGGTTVYPDAATITANLPAGTYTFTATITDACLATCTSSIQVVVNPLPSIAVNPTSGLICNPGGAAVTLTASGGDTYSWSPTSGLNVATGATVSAGPSSNTTYIVSGTDANGCVNTASASISVGLSPLGLSAFASPPTVCSGGSTTLTAASAEPSGANTYSFSPSSGVFTTLSAGIPLTAVNADQAIAAAPIGFNFTFAGNTYTTVYASSNGFISFNPAAVFSDGNNLDASAATMYPLIAPLWDDMDGSDAGGSASYETSGTVGNQVFTFEWKNWEWDWFSDAAVITFQVKLYEADNHIEFVYQEEAAAVDAFGASIGIASAPGNFISLTNSSASPGASTSTETDGIITKPATGQVYSFFPSATTLTYAWEPSALVTNPGSAVTTTTALTATTTFTVTATYGICSLTEMVTVVAGAPLTCDPATASSPVCAGNDFTVTANPVGGGEPYSYSWSDGSTTVYPNAQTITANLPAGTYTFTATVTDNCGASCNSSVIVTVNSVPSVAVTPNSASRCLPGGAAIQLNASGASTYTWSPSGGLSDTQGAIVLAEPINTTTYTVTGIDANGCVGSSTATITVATTPSGVTASASQTSICSGATTTLNATAACLSGALKITEVTQFNGGTGTTPTYPAYLSIIPDDHVEISNISSSPVDVSGLIYEVWTGTSLLRTVTIPASTVLPGNSVLIIGIGTGTDNPSMYFFHTGGTSDVLFSSLAAGHLIKFGAGIVDAVALNSYAWPGASGVTAADWNGSGLSASGRAGVIRTAASDNNDVADWSLSDSPSPLQSQGTYNGGYIYTPCTFVYAWEPSALVTSPSSDVTTTTALSATTTFTVTVSNGPCSSTATVQVVVGAALVCSPATYTSPNCANTDFTVTANHSGGGGPYSYAWSDGVGGVYPNAQTITANLPAGTYNFSCVVSDACGASCNSDVTVVVNAAPPVAISPSSALICMPGGSSVTLTASGATSYSWAPSAGLSATTGSPVEAFPTATTTYTVTGTDANGCVATATSTITRANTPTNVVATANPPAVCFGEFSNLNATATIPQDYCAIPNTSSGVCGSDEWIENVTFNTINNTTTCNIPTGLNDHTNISTNISPGNYTLTALINTPFSSDLLTVYIDFNQDGDFTDLDEEFDATFASPTMTANVVVPPTAFNGPTRMRVRLTFSTAPQPCGQSSFGEAEDYTVIISGGVTNPGAVTYHWEPATGLKPNADVQNPETPALPAGTTVYTVTVSNNGCTATATTSVVSGTALVCSPVTTSGPLCSGGFSATANHTGGGAPYSYAWSDGVGGVYPNSQTVTVALPAGVYTLECTVTDNCGNSCLSSTTVTVNHTPAASIAEGSPITVCTPNLPLTLNAVTDIGGVSYQWKKNGTAIGGQTASSLSVTTAGSYSVLITLGSCSSESAPTVVTIQDVTNAPTSVTPSDITVCVGAASSGDFTGSCDQTLTFSGATGLPFTWTSTLLTSTATLNVGGFAPGSTITDVSISLDINHTWGGDLVMSLQAPNGGPTLFITNDDVNDPNLDYGTPPNGTAPALPYVYNMSGVALPATGDVVSPGPYLPFDDFNGFDGLDPNGVWTLSVGDAIGGDGGTVTNMQLTISAVSPPPAWYTTSSGGTPVHVGHTFNPITNGGASTATPGVIDYYVECGSGGACPSSRTHVTFTVQSCGGPTLNSCVMIEGFYQGGGLMAARAFTCGSSLDPTDADQITVAAVECTGSGFNVVDQQTTMVKTDGSFSCTFSAAVITGQPYYLRITNCGTTETWSAAPVTLSAVTSYSFCLNPANTFVGNVKPLDATYYGMFSGDVNGDGAIDGSDFLDMDPLIQSGAGCDDCNDLNGDGAVDGSDFLILDPNIQNGIGAALPTCP